MLVSYSITRKVTENDPNRPPGVDNKKRTYYEIIVTKTVKSEEYVLKSRLIDIE